MKPQPTAPSCLRNAVLLGLSTVVLASGCASSATQSNLMKRGQVDQVSAEELRIQVRALAAPFSGIIEQAGDEMLELTDAPELRRSALRWKINGVPAFQAALFQPDPLAALLDAWAQIVQIRNVLDTGVASERPEELKRIVYDALDRMEAELEKVAADLGPEAVERLGSIVTDWAARNPMSSLSTRPPTTSELAAITANSRAGLRQTVTALNETMGDLATRIDVYTTFLPKQARWQAEYLLTEMLGGADVEGLVGQVDSLAESVGTIAATVDQLPDVVTRERTAVLQAVREERLAVLEAMHAELESVMDFIDLQRREALAGDLRSERLAVMEGVTAERIAALQTIRHERIEALEELEAISARVIEESMKELVDHVFLRLAQGLLVLLGIAIVLLWLWRGRGSRRQHAA